MRLRESWYFAAGIAFLALAKGKSLARGYSTPKPFGLSDITRCVAYDFHVVDGWLAELARYARCGTFLADKNVVELGPGSDLGAGILLLASGARTYTACDVHDLATRAPHEFYEALFARMESCDPVRGRLDALRRELDALRAGRPSRLRYLVRPSFDLPAVLADRNIDIVVSQAAFEHFDDVDAVIGQLSAVCNPGAVLIAEVDLKTHSRWIRDRDPNNIYRYPDRLYGAFRFPGSPNRVRPREYRAILERHGWECIEIVPRTELDPGKKAPSVLNRRFADAANQMGYLTIMLCATYGPRRRST